MTYERKQITFWLAMLSVFVLTMSIISWWSLRMIYFDEVLVNWFFSSLPLIVNLFHYAIYREDKNDKQDSKED